MLSMKAVRPVEIRGLTYELYTNDAMGILPINTVTAGESDVQLHNN
jgi:hypothetical protein